MEATLSCLVGAEKISCFLWKLVPLNYIDQACQIYSPWTRPDPLSPIIQHWCWPHVGPVWGTLLPHMLDPGPTASALAGSGRGKGGCEFVGPQHAGCGTRSGQSETVLHMAPIQDQLEQALLDSHVLDKPKWVQWDQACGGGGGHRSHGIDLDCGPVPGNSSDSLTHLT